MLVTASLVVTIKAVSAAWSAGKFAGGLLVLFAWPKALSSIVRATLDSKSFLTNLGLVA